MTQVELANFIWSVADLLRGPYRPPQYERVMLPMTVLRRFDCVLAATKPAVLKRYKQLEGGKVKNLDPILNKVAGGGIDIGFHNHGDLDFEKLKGEPAAIALNLMQYIKGFSANVRDIFLEYLRGQTTEPSFAMANGGSVVAEDDDLLLLWDGANAGEFLRARSGVVSSTVALITPKDIDSEFLYWTCKGHERLVRSESKGLGTGTMGFLRLYSDNFLAMHFPCPPLNEQREIAKHLGTQTDETRLLLEALKDSLRLLSMRRTAVISGTVTGQMMSPERSLMRKRAIRRHCPWRQRGG